MRTIKLASGVEYEVPEENFEAAMQALDSKGIKFNADVRPDTGPDTGPPPEPEAAQPPGRSTPMVEPNPNMTGEFQEKPGVLEQLVNGGQDALSGFTHGATMHNDANMWDAVGGRQYGDRIRSANAVGQNRSPNIYGTAEMLGGAVPTLAMGAAGLAGRAANGVGQLGRAVSNFGAQGLQGAIGGYARGYGDSDPDAPVAERGHDAAAQAEHDGILSSLVSGGASALGSAAGVAKDLWASASDKARAAAVGFGGQDLKKIARDKGLDFVEENVGRLPEQLGVTNRVIPQSASTYAKRFEDRAAQADQQIGQSTVDAEAQGVKGPGFIDKPGMVGKVRQAGNAVARGPLGDRDARAGAIENVASGMAQQPISTPAELRALKSSLDSVAYPSALEGSSESIMGQAHKVGGDVARNQLRDAMGYALPETNQAFTQGNIDYGHAATMAGVSRDAAAQRYAGGGLMGNMGAAAVGAAAGAPFGQASTGAALGLARPAYAAAQNYGADFGANMARGLEGGSGVGERLGNAVANSPAGALGAGATPSDKSRQLAGESRGYLGAQAIEMVLQRNPEALGKYGPELQQAQKDGTLNGALYKLYMRDQDFRQSVYPQIQQLTRASDY